MTRRVGTWLALAALVLGCGGGDDEPPAPLVDSGFQGAMVPDPGDHPANWAAGEYEGHTTPETAHPVGVVTENNPYVVAYIDPVSGDAFWVFRAGPSFDRLDIALAGNVAEVIHTHVHEVDAGRVGAVVPARNASATRGTWGLSPGAIYLLEVHTVAGGFV